MKFNKITPQASRSRRGETVTGSRGGCVRRMVMRQGAGGRFGGECGRGAGWVEPNAVQIGQWEWSVTRNNNYMKFQKKQTKYS